MSTIAQAISQVSVSVVEEQSVTDYIKYIHSHPYTVYIEDHDGVIIWRRKVTEDSEHLVDYQINLENQIAYFIQFI